MWNMTFLQPASGTVCPIPLCLFRPQETTIKRMTFDPYSTIYGQVIATSCYMTHQQKLPRCHGYTPIKSYKLHNLASPMSLDCTIQNLIRFKTIQSNL